MRTSLKLSLAVAGAALGLATTAHAQTSGSINATATVLTQLVVTGTDLAFGNIAQTQTKTIAASGAAAGKFNVKGASGASVTLSFTAVPASLGTGLALGSWTGVHGLTQGGGTSFTPSTSFTQAVNLDASGDYFVWVGATLTATGAAPGSYSAPVTLQVIYN